jgi:arylformamidase
MATRIIDLSHAITNTTPPFPGGPPVEVKFLELERNKNPGDRYVHASRFAMNIHCGTHMDAPFHFVPGGRTIDQVPLERTYGIASLVDLRYKAPGSQIERADLESAAPRFRETRRVILQTGWSSHWKQPDFFTRFPDITPDAAQFLVDSGVQLVGLEAPSVDYDPNDTHIVFLSNDVILVECLTGLEQIPGTEFLFSATPLNIAGHDGSPVRAIAILEV